MQVLEQFSASNSIIPVCVSVELVSEVRQVDVEGERVEGEGPVRHAQRRRRRAHRDARHGVPGNDIPSTIF